MHFKNKVWLMGNLTRDPVLKFIGEKNTPVVDFGIAINRTFKKADKSTAQEVCFVDCVMRGKRAETIDKWFKKGKPIDIEGRLELNSWEKDGKKHYKMRVVVENWEFVNLGKKQDDDGDKAPVGAPTQESLEDDTIPF